MNNKMDDVFLKNKISEMFDRKYVFLMGRATSAIYLALRAMKKKHGNVILPDLLCPSPANAVLYSGLKPVFCDVNLNDYNMDISSLEKTMSKQTKAIIAVHLFGQPADMKKIEEIAKDQNALVIEDVAQALGGKLNGKILGSFGELSVLSFGKILGTGDGGALLTDSLRLANEIEANIKMLPVKPMNLEKRYLQYKNYYYKIASLPDSHERRYLFQTLPEFYSDLYLYGFTENNVMRVIEGLAKLDENCQTRKMNAELYKKKLNHPDIIHPKYENDGTYYRYSILLRSRCKDVTDGLRKRGYDASNLYFVPLHEMYVRYMKTEKMRFKNTNYISQRILNIWVEPGITKSYIEGVCETIMEELEK